MNIKVKMLIIVEPYQCVWKEPFASSHAGGPGSGWYLAERKAGESSLIHSHFFLLWSCSVMASWKQVCWRPLSFHLWTLQMWWSSDFHWATPEKQKSVYYTREVCKILKNNLFEWKNCNLTNCKSLYNLNYYLSVTMAQAAWPVVMRTDGFQPWPQIFILFLACHGHRFLHFT